MGKSKLRILSCLSAALLLCGLGACKPGEKTPASGTAPSSGTGGSSGSKEVIFGSHYIPTWDPTYVDPVTLSLIHI